MSAAIYLPTLAEIRREAEKLYGGAEAAYSFGPEGYGWDGFIKAYEFIAGFVADCQAGAPGCEQGTSFSDGYMNGYRNALSTLLSSIDSGGLSQPLPDSPSAAQAVMRAVVRELESRAREEAWRAAQGRVHDSLVKRYGGSLEAERLAERHAREWLDEMPEGWGR